MDGGVRHGAADLGLHHDQVLIGNKVEWFHPSRNLGVMDTTLLLLLILVTSTAIKGMKAALIPAALAFFTLLFAHLRQPDKNNLPDVLWLDNDAPFGERVGTLQALFKGPKGSLLRETHTAFVGVLQQPNDRRGRHSISWFWPTCRTGLSCPEAIHSNAFEYAPASLDGIVLAVIGGIIGQFDYQLVEVGEFHQAFDELSSMTGNVRTVVQVHLQFADVGIHGLSLVPPKLHAIDDEVARFPGGAENDRQLIAGDFENPEGDKDGRNLRIVIQGFRGLLSSGFATAR